MAKAGTGKITNRIGGMMLTREQKLDIRDLVETIIYSGNEHQIEFEKEKYLAKIVEIVERE